MTALDAHHRVCGRGQVDLVHAAVLSDVIAVLDRRLPAHAREDRTATQGNIGTTPSKRSWGSKLVLAWSLTVQEWPGRYRREGSSSLAR